MLEEALANAMKKNGDAGQGLRIDCMANLNV